MVGVLLLITQGLGNTRRTKGAISVKNLVSKLIREEILLIIITIIIIITRPQWPKLDSQAPIQFGCVHFFNGSLCASYVRHKTGDKRNKHTYTYYVITIVIIILPATWLKRRPQGWQSRARWRWKSLGVTWRGRRQSEVNLDSYKMRKREKSSYIQLT